MKGRGGSQLLVMRPRTPPDPPGCGTGRCGDIKGAIMAKEKIKNIGVEKSSGTGFVPGLEEVIGNKLNSALDSAISRLEKNKSLTEFNQLVAKKLRGLINTYILEDDISREFFLNLDVNFPYLDDEYDYEGLGVMVTLDPHNLKILDTDCYTGIFPATSYCKTSEDGCREITLVKKGQQPSRETVVEHLKEGEVYDVYEFLPTTSYKLDNNPFLKHGLTEAEDHNGCELVFYDPEYDKDREKILDILPELLEARYLEKASDYSYRFSLPEDIKKERRRILKELDGKKIEDIILERIKDTLKEKVSKLDDNNLVNILAKYTLGYLPENTRLELSRIVEVEPDLYRKIREVKTLPELTLEDLDKKLEKVIVEEDNGVN